MTLDAVLGEPPKPRDPPRIPLGTSGYLRCSGGRKSSLRSPPSDSEARADTLPQPSLEPKNKLSQPLFSASHERGRIEARQDRAPVHPSRLSRDAAGAASLLSLSDRAVALLVLLAAAAGARVVAVDLGQRRRRGRRVPGRRRLAALHRIEGGRGGRAARGHARRQELLGGLELLGRRLGHAAGQG